ncbi:MAG: hypothetical protein QOF61_287 [Acidobacteriota bacterium]|jgi:hypothetical protein|nr:hypothetical protein [Acidobacteriota bacterium]
MNPVRVLERLTLTAPLGVTFHDTATGLRVGSGLDVSIYAKRTPLARRAKMLANPSGIYVLHHAPALSREVEFGAGDEDFWTETNLLPPQTYVMEVVDTQRRFQPFSLEVDLPVRGIFNWVSPLDTSPPSPQAHASIPLYSATARGAPPGMALIRAELRDATAAAPAEAPAAWAVVEASYEGELVARGITDARGSLALIFPYPQPPTFAVASPVESPPETHSPSLFKQKWDVVISAAYVGIASGARVPEIPDLRATLEQLSAPPARVWSDRVGGTELSSVTLQYGRELVLKTVDPALSSPPASPSALLVTPAGSPP